MRRRKLAPATAGARRARRRRGEGRARRRRAGRPARSRDRTSRCGSSAGSPRRTSTTRPARPRAFDMMLALDPEPLPQLHAVAEGDVRVREGAQGDAGARRAGDRRQLAARPQGRRSGAARRRGARRSEDSSCAARRCSCARAARPAGARPTSRSPARASAASCCRRSPRDKPVSLELYLRAYDDRGNEVLTWADPTRPREIPLRYDPPTAVVPQAGGCITRSPARRSPSAPASRSTSSTIAPPDKINASLEHHEVAARCATPGSRAGRSSRAARSRPRTASS